jgi:hypothetical protein
VPTYPPASYTEAIGRTYVIKALNSNTAASTLDINALGAKAILRPNGDQLSADDIIAGYYFSVVYNGTAFQIMNSIPGVVQDAIDAQSAAQTAQGLAEAAQSAAETAQTNAETAETNAETAETNAETAQAAAETARDLSSEWAEKAEDADITGSPGSFSALHHSAKANAQRVLAETAKTEAETAQSNAESAQSAAEAAQSAAELVYDTFDDRFLGAKSGAPSVDNDGGALQVGAMYWNTQFNKMQIWSGTEWYDQLERGATLTRFEYTSGASQSVFAGLDDNGYILDYSPGLEQVFVDGELQIPTVDYNTTDQYTITFTPALSSGARVAIAGFKQAYAGVGGSEINRFVYTATAAQSVFSGVDDNTNEMVFTSGYLGMVTKNGVVMVQGVDYNESGQNEITLTTPANLNDVIAITALQQVGYIGSYVPATDQEMADGTVTEIRSMTPAQVKLSLGYASVMLKS